MRQQEEAGVRLPLRHGLAGLLRGGQEDCQRRRRGRGEDHAAAGTGARLASGRRGEE